VLQEPGRLGRRPGDGHEVDDGVAGLADGDVDPDGVVEGRPGEHVRQAQALVHHLDGPPHERARPDVLAPELAVQHGPARQHDGGQVDVPATVTRTLFDIRPGAGDSFSYDGTDGGDGVVQRTEVIINRLTPTMAGS
jgi:hypothetical protein